MNKVLRIYLLMLVALVVGSCSDGRQAEIIRQAEQIMQEQPDSALHLLQSIPRKSLRGETLARYALIYSMAQDKSGLDVTSDSLLRIAYDYYRQHPEDTLYARSQYYMGKYLWLTEQTDSAYNCLLKAKTASETEKDYYTAYLAADRMRRIVEVSDTTFCLSLSKDAYRLYIMHGAPNLINEIYLLVGVGDSYFRCEDSDSTLLYYNLALKKSKEEGDSIVISSVLQNMSRFYNHYHQNEKALEYARQALEYRGYLDQSLAMLLIQCYTEIEEYDRAWQYIKALQDVDSKEDNLVKLSIIHRFFAKTGDADATQEYFDSAIDVAADMYLSTQKEKLELHRNNMQEELERQRAESRGKLLAVILWFSVVILLLVLWLFIKYYRSKKAEIAHQKKQNRTLEELNKKEKEHKEQMMEQTRYYVKNMIGVLRKLEEYRRERAKHEERAKESNSKVKADKKDKVRMKIDDKEWDELQAYLEACDDSFVTRFKERFPNISIEDYRLCLLLRCGFTNSDLDMVYLNGMQVIKNKQNLAKDRLGISDKGLSLREYIKHF